MFNMQDILVGWMGVKDGALPYSWLVCGGKNPACECMGRMRCMGWLGLWSASNAWGAWGAWGE